MAEAIICAFNVTRRFLGNVCHELVGDGLVEGSVSLKKISDMDYSFEFLSDCGLVMIYADIDDFRVVEGNKFQIVIGEQYVYAIEGRSDYLLFRDAVYECQLLMEVSYHFKLIKSNHYIKLSKLLNLGGGSPRDGDSIISKDDEYQVPKTLFDQAKQQCSDPLVILEGVRNIVCVFCKAEKVMEKNLTFALHPYVPVNFENKNIYMCFRCLDNWRQFREEAICDDTLIPLDESNEDLCGICSVSASELFLCSSCPRSFCGPCLEFILTAQQVVQVKEPYDWVCMCCVAKVGSMSPSAMSSDWCIAVVEYAHLLSHEPQLRKQNSSYLHDNVLPVICIEDEDDTIIETSQLQEPLISYPSHQITKKCHRETGRGILNCLSILPEGNDFCTTSNEGSNVVRCGKDKMKPLDQVVNIVSEAKTANSFKNKNKSSDSYKIVMDQQCRGNKDDGTTVAAHPNYRDIPLDSGIINELTSKKTKSNLKLKCNEETKSTEQTSPIQSKKEEITVATEEAVVAYDAVQYFKRYLQDLELCSREEQTYIGIKKKYPTDDVCFLCKDGGDLLECDYVHRDLPVRRPCQRVYHRHCLPFEVSMRNKNWKCPRHYCDFCGNSRLRYMCKYCPMSACAACSKPGSGKVTIPLSGSEGHVRFTDHITVITCDSCRSMIARCSRGKGKADTTSSVEAIPTTIASSKSTQPLACRPCKKPAPKRKRP